MKLPDSKIVTISTIEHKTGKAPILQIPAMDGGVACAGEGETPIGREGNRGDASALFDEESPIFKCVVEREGKKERWRERRLRREDEAKRSSRGGRERLGQEGSSGSRD